MQSGVGCWDRHWPGALSPCCGEAGLSTHTTYLFLQAAFGSSIVITQLMTDTALEK